MRRGALARTRWVPLVAGLLALALIGATGSRAVAQATPPNRFYGTATVDGQIAFAGMAVQAFIGGVPCGDGVVAPGGGYSIDVVSAVSRPGCGYDGAAVTFALGGIAADQIAIYQTGGFTQLDLSVHGQSGPQPTRPGSPAPVPVPPARFFGSITLNGGPFPTTSTIDALIGGVVCGSGGVTAGGAYAVDVASASVAAGCGTPGAIVSFRVGGTLPVNETGVFTIGGYTQLNLTIGGSQQPAATFIERRIYGRIILDPGQGVRFTDPDRPANQRRSHRVINSGGISVVVEDDGETITISAPGGTAVLLVETRSADCGQLFGQPNVVACSVARRARITFTAVAGNGF